MIDRALATFAADERETYRMGMDQIQLKRRELFPGSTTIQSLTSEQQMTLNRAIEATTFFELLRTHTVLGFLGNPTNDTKVQAILYRRTDAEKARPLNAIEYGRQVGGVKCSFHSQLLALS